MNISFSELKVRALNSLSGNWGPVIGTYLVYFLVIVTLQYTFIGAFIAGGALTLGMAIFNLSVSRGNEFRLTQIFDGFKNFVNSMVTYLLSLLYILLWTLLFIIPGIIATYSYSMIFYILADEPELTPSETLKKSKEMMDGYKMDFFLLNLSFIGWAILCLFTLGIGFLWLFPYILITNAKFYEEVRRAYYGDAEFGDLDEIGRPDDPANPQFNF